MSASDRPKVLVFVVAEATLDLIVPWAEQGRLPTFARLMSEGTFGTLRSRFPLSTVERWSNLTTGVDAGRHGIYDVFQRRGSGRFHEVSRLDLEAPMLWQRLSDAGIRCCVVNVPLAYPPPRIDGYVLAGHDAPGTDRSMASPPSVYDRIVERFSSYRLDENYFRNGRRLSEYPKRFEQGIPAQAEVLEYLIGGREWDFFLTWHNAIAQAQHFFWADMDAMDATLDDSPYRHVVERVYQMVDRALERSIHAAGPEAKVFILSDCGAGPVRYGVNVNRWLEQRGLLAYLPEAAGERRNNVRRIWQSIPFHRIRPDLMLRYLLPEGPASRIGGAMRRVRERMQAAVYTEIDWSRTRAYERGIQGTVFINVEGREPGGIVAPGAEYESVRDSIIAGLAELRDPDSGAPVVRRVYRREELYDGSTIDRAPDLFIDWADMAYLPTNRAANTAPRDSAVVVPRRRGDEDFESTGDHRRDGVVFAIGPGIARGRRIEGASVFDIVPTCLEIFGLPLPAELVGAANGGLTSRLRPA